MNLDLKQLFDLPGAKQEIDCSLDLSKEKLYGAMPFTQPVRVAGTIENRAGVVRLVFSVKSVLSLTCDRCLKAFEKTVDYSFSHIVVRELSNTDDEEFDYVVCEDGILDLAELARADLMLELPGRTAFFSLGNVFREKYFRISPAAFQVRKGFRQRPSLRFLRCQA